MIGRHGSPFGRVAVTSAPAAEPVTTAQAKSWLRVSGSDDDTLIDAIVASARRWVEEYCGIRLITQTVTQTIDDWPGSAQSRAEAITVDQAKSGALQWVELLASPVQSISSVKTYDDSDNEATWGSGNYRLSAAADGDRARLVPVGSASWPSATRNSDGVVIEYVAGFGDAGSDVPADITLALRLLIAGMYENRGDLSGVSDAVIGAAQRQLAPYRVMGI